MQIRCFEVGHRRDVAKVVQLGHDCASLVETGRPDQAGQSEHRFDLVDSRSAQQLESHNQGKTIDLLQGYGSEVLANQA